MPVLLGAKEKVPLRLVVEKLPEEVTTKKRQKTRKYHNKKTITLRNTMNSWAAWCSSPMSGNKY